jgi:Predicted permeases
MLQDILTVAGQVLSLFLMMGIGALLTRRGTVTEDGVSQMSYILMNIVAPCVIIDSLQRDKDLSLVREMGIAAGIITVSTLIGVALSFLFFRREPPADRRVLRFAMTFSNCGYMGLPLVQATLGSSALVYAASAVIAFNVLLWTVGIVMMGGRQEASVKNAILNPGIIGFAIAFTLFWFEIRLPSVLGSTVSMLASLNTPVAMIVVGSYVAKSNLSLCFSQKKLYLAAGLRLVVIPVALTALFYPLHLPFELYAASVLVSSAPTAAITTIFSTRYKLDSALASQCVTLCTLLSILTMPVLAAVIRVIST